VKKEHEAWKTQERLIRIAKEGPEFTVTVLTLDKREVKTVQAALTKDGG